MRRTKICQSWMMLLRVAVATGAVALVSCKKSEPANTATPSTAGTTAAAGKSAKKEFQGLVGRWQRPDVGFVLEIRGVAADGNLDVAYSAPRLVQVGKAVAVQESGAVKVVLELQDPSLMGSKYTLKFDPQANRLNGVYFQAVLGESEDIFFVRMQ